MSDTVIILGAGASQAGGAPLMKDFLQCVEDLNQRHPWQEIAPDFQLVQAARVELQRTQSKTSCIDLHNIESVFAAFEMARIIGRLGNLSQDDVKRLPTAMRHVIAYTLENHVRFHWERDGLKAPTPYPALAELLPLEPGLVSIVSFNYDIGLDYALYARGLSVDYCLDPVQQKGPNQIKLLKLHGSLNWVLCPGCEQVRAWPFRDFFGPRPLLFSHVKPGNTTSLQMMQSLPEFRHCGEKAPAACPAIVPPTWNKTEYAYQLKNVWQAAARELSQARNIVVCGYSLPESDIFFKYLFALGTVSDTFIRNFWVFDIDGGIEAAFKSLLGLGAAQSFKMHNKTFQAAVREELGSLLKGLSA